MTEVRFYHLTKNRLEDVLPGILQKACDRKSRVVVQSSLPERVDALNGLLWSFDPASFLAHGTKADGFAADQPVFLTTADENPNGADILILTDGAQSGAVASYALCCEIFDGADETAVAGARTRWAAYKDKGFALKYYQQGERGGWEEKAAA